MLHFFHYVADKYHIDLNFKVTIQIINSFDHESFYVFLSFFLLISKSYTHFCSSRVDLLHVVKEHMNLYFNHLFLCPFYMGFNVIV